MFNYFSSILKLISKLLVILLFFTKFNVKIIYTLQFSPFLYYTKHKTSLNIIISYHIPSYLFTSYLTEKKKKKKTNVVFTFLSGSEECGFFLL